MIHFPYCTISSVLFQALLELESSASSDEAVRERIASLPPEVSEVQLLSKLEGKLTVQHRLRLVIRIAIYLRGLRDDLARARPCECTPKPPGA